MLDNPNDVFGPNTDDVAEPYLDENDDYNRDTWERYCYYNQNGVFDGETNCIYNGSLCSGDQKANGDCITDLVYVQAEIKPLVMSGSSADNISFDPGVVDLREQDFEEVNIYIVDVNNNPMPYGTKIELTTTNGKLESKASYKVPSTIIPFPYPVIAVIKPDDASDDKIAEGLLLVTVTTPHGNQTVGSITVSD